MRHTLLLADDSITIQRVIELTFAGEDVAVVSVGDGEQAIERIRQDRPDIVLADIGMPKRSGYDVAAFVTGQLDLAHVPVLLLAGAFEPIDRERMQAVGARGVLVKPFEPRHVIARVRELLARPALEAPRSSPIFPSEAAEAAIPAPVPLSDQPSEPMHAGPAAESVAVARVEEPVPAGGEAQQVETPPVEETLPVEVPSVEVAPMAVASPSLESPSWPPSAPARGHEALDDIFARLGSLSEPSAVDRATAPPAAPRARGPYGIDDAWTYGEVPTVGQLLDRPTVEWPSGGRAGEETRHADPLDAFDVDRPRVEAREPSGQESAAGRNLIADAFHALLSAEQGRPIPTDAMPTSAEPVRSPSPETPLLVTDELVDRVAQRVLARLVPNAARDMVVGIVSDVAERLVREELARARTRGEDAQLP